MSRTITVTSGKGGVGKTNIALNLAFSLARNGKKVCLFDVDLGLANINILLGLYPKATLKDIIFGDRQPQDIILRASGIDILPGSSGIEELANLDSDRLQQLVEQFSSLEQYDYIIFDTSAGIARNVMAFCLAASELLMVITPEPTSLTDAYALLKVMAANGFRGTVRTILNNCKNAGEAKETYYKFKRVVDQYLALPVQALGPVYRDERVTEAVRRQKPFAKLFPESIASRCLQKITERLLSGGEDASDRDYLVSFWQRCLSFFSQPVVMPGEDGKEPKPEPLTASFESTSAADEALTKNTPGPPGPPGPAAPPPAARRKPEEAEQDHGLVPAGAGEIWEVLIEGVMNISQELRLLRESIDNLQPGGANRRSPDPDLAEEASENAPRIVLDLASYIQNQQNGEGD